MAWMFVTFHQIWSIFTTALPACAALKRSDLPFLSVLRRVFRVGVDLGSQMEGWLSSPQRGRTVLEPWPIMATRIVDS